MSFHVDLSDVSVRIKDGVLKTRLVAHFPYYLDPIKISFELETDLDSGFEMDIRSISSDLFLFIPTVTHFEHDSEYDYDQFRQICFMLQNEINQQLFKVHLQEALIEEMERDCYIKPRD